MKPGPHSPAHWQAKLAAKSLRVGVIGLGYVGLPLTHVFWQAGFSVTGFDTDPEKIGAELADCRILPIEELVKTNAKFKAEIGVVAVPREVAQEVVDKLVAAGVRAILNFAPTTILVRPGIAVRNVDLTSQLEVLSYYLRSK